MIPKVLHFIWFGGRDFPALETKCIESWKRYLPDYEIKRWDESNYFSDDPGFAKAFKKKQWAFCADFARLDILVKHGGVYLDTDVELVKSFDSFLEHQCFVGMESEQYMGCAIIGAQAGDAFMTKCLDEVRASLLKDFIPMPKIFQYVYENNSFPMLKVYSRDYFYPYNPFAYPIKNLMFSDLTENTHAIHHWNYSWRPSVPERIVAKVKRIMSKNKFIK